jgi:hypothetical protein
LPFLSILGKKKTVKKPNQRRLGPAAGGKRPVLVIKSQVRNPSLAAAEYIFFSFSAAFRKKAVDKHRQDGYNVFNPFER